MAYKSELKDILGKSSDKYYELIQSSHIAMGAVSDDKLIFINNAGLNLFGASGAENILSGSFTNFFIPEHRSQVKTHFQNLLEDKTESTPFELKIIQLDSSILDVELIANKFTYENQHAIQFSLYKITKRKKMEELLYQSKQDWEETFHAITDMITIHDTEFNIIYSNKAAQNILNVPASSNELSKCFEYYHGTICPPNGCPSCGCLKTGEPADFEIFEPHLNKYVEIRSMPRFDKDNKLIGLIHITRDVSERKKSEAAIQKANDELEMRVEERTSELKIANKKLKEEIAERKLIDEALRKSENEFRNLSQEFHTLLDGIPDNLILLSPELKIMWSNTAANNVLKIDNAEVNGAYCYSTCCNILSPCENCPTIRSFSSGCEETAEITTPENKVWDIRAFPIKDENGTVKSVIELARDITEKVNLQAGATRTRHLASLGELAAGVAHEINNPVNNIINYAQILIDEFKIANTDDEVPRRIMKDGDRIATIVRSLLSFARIRQEEKSFVYLHEIFSDTLSLTSAQIRKDGIHLIVNVPSEFLKIPVHPQQIQQVFLNIISNSRYSLNEKYPGTHENKILEIRCEEIIIDNTPNVKIIFHDYGMGISSKIIDKVLNPFFSTKPNRVGTGLGLSISHGIITEHGGKLSIDSHEGEYTKITINLPKSLASRE